MKKRLITALLCGAMALSLVACGGSGNSTEGGDSGAQNESSKDEADSKKEKPDRKYVKQSSYNYTTGELVSEMETRYDEKGREVYKKQTNYSVDPNQKEPSVLEYEYEWVEEGNKATASNAYFTATITYDDAGNMLEKEEGNAASKTISAYSYKDGKLAVKKDVTYYMGEEYTIMEQEFDAYGNVTKVSNKIISTDTEYVTCYKYEYDKDGNVLSLSLSQDGVESGEQKLEYIYDENGHLDRVELAGVLYQDYTCDENGNVIESITYNGELIVAKSIVEYFDK